MMAKYSDLFSVFLKVGLFTIGGGYAMIPLMQREVVERHRWVDEGEFLDMVGISQAMPGVFAVNMATMTGYRLRGVRGSVVCVAGNVLIPILCIVLFAIFFRVFRENKVVESVFMGLRPAVVALIAVPVVTLAKGAKVTWSNCWIPVVSGGLIWLLGVSPVWVVLGAVVLGLILKGGEK